ncbi:Inactive pancreatic lipase-related protein 1 [Orchesella cincta]|uniref:Inactive pancreatic lipase-related protein 1 n=1 Tax=Orchesella cincta TaxID=48709 RepID=A0A1D2NH05_ORCCI|nr:Inactive pancreatic lipase-related protein 1 [Orchesella cincta]
MTYKGILFLCVVGLLGISASLVKGVNGDGAKEDPNDDLLMSGAGESQELPPLEPIPSLSSLLPTLVKGKPRKLKDILFRKAPIFEEMLRRKEKRVLEVADKTFTLQFASLPVKKLTSDVDETSSEEVLETRAFEMLSGIVARLVKDVLICSATESEDSVTFNKSSICSNLDLVGHTRMRANEDDSPTECDGSDEDCEVQGRSGVKRPRLTGIPGKSLDYKIYIHSTHRPSHTQPLPTNGKLEGIKIWDKEAPTKLILNLFPYEFCKKENNARNVTHQMIYAFDQRYGHGSENHNIIEVRWPEIWKKKLSIVSVVARLLPTADRLAKLFTKWHKKDQIVLDTLHIIGFSVGAHLAGIFAQNVKKRTSGEAVCRITGLDPIGWGFDMQDEGHQIDHNLSLTPDDAKLVDVIHTSTPDTAYPFIHYGTNQNRGSVDFYPNNGRAKYCTPTDGLCHHFYSTTLFAASIYEATFPACLCPSWEEFITRKCEPCTDVAKMGEQIGAGVAHGMYYLSTA